MNHLADMAELARNHLLIRNTSVDEDDKENRPPTATLNENADPGLPRPRPRVIQKKSVHISVFGIKSLS